jgi:hypothetical protein
MRSIRSGSKRNVSIRSKRNGIKRTQHGGQKPFKKVQCAPKSKDIQKFTCYEENDLLKMRDLWNARHRDAPIEAKMPKDIWLALKAKMAAACDTESCWLKQKFMENNLDEKLSTYTFAPKSPLKWKEKHTTWLNSDDIEKIMKQYEHTFKCFRFIGPTPIDFDTQLHDKECVWEDLCHFDLSDFIKKGVNKIGIIFNTDPHTKSGAHWISLFINIKKRFIFFFDSNGTEMPRQIEAFVKRITEQGEKNGIKFKFDQNAPFAHQEGNTECGMYSLYLIVSLLKDKHTCKYFKTTKIHDAAVEHLRDTYYNSDL